MKLYFRNNDCQLVEIASPNTQEEAYQEICRYMKENNLKSHYMRYWMDENIPNRIWCDFGSHTEFFVLDGEI